jgi:hypothetical protein
MSTPPDGGDTMPNELHLVVETLQETLDRKKRERTETPIPQMVEGALAVLGLLGECDRRGTEDHWSVARESRIFGTLGTPCIQAYDDETLVAGPGGDWGEGRPAADDIVLVAAARNALPALRRLATIALTSGTVTESVELREALYDLASLGPWLVRVLEDAKAARPRRGSRRSAARP